MTVVQQSSDSIAFRPSSRPAQRWGYVFTPDANRQNGERDDFQRRAFIGKIAELLAPAKHESLASTFGGFLRVALGVNMAFYFAILALAAYLWDRRRRSQ